ncbi:MAG: hypothetical protein ACLUIZ_05870 [Agathobacter rectalis]
MGAGAGAQKITTDVTGNDTAGMVAGMVASGVTAKGLNGYVDPRNIPPSVIEDAISSTKGIPGNRPDTFIHETADVKIVINSAGKVITVIPK